MSLFRSFFRLRVRLTLKFVMAMVFLVMMTSASFGWFFVGREVSFLRSQMESRGRWVARTFGLLSELPPARPDREALQRLAERMVREKDLFLVTYAGPSGERLAHAEKEGETPSIRSFQIETYPVLSPSGQSLGSLRVGLVQSGLESRMEALRNDLLLLALGVVAVGLLFTLIFTRLFLRPIEKLVEATELVAHGELPITVDIRSRDEIGELAKAFNSMTRQLKESRDDLEGKVERRTRQLEANIEELKKARAETLNMLSALEATRGELEKANSELQEMNEAKMKLIGTASHELKTPLTAIKGNTDFLLSEKEGAVPDYMKSYLLTIQRNTNRLHRIMDHMLDLTRIASGHRRLVWEPIALAEVIREYINEIKPVDKVLLTETVIPDGLAVHADRDALHDIFINLLSNAFKFTPEGGRIRVSAAPQDRFVLHEVRDSGIGIPEEKAHRVFEEFYQIESGKYGGTGLGLSIVRRLIEEHGGKIWVESATGRGSAFFFTLPRVMEPCDGECLS
jgi:signal transduction histidine kinase